jgi:hypothetical protein
MLTNVATIANNLAPSSKRAVGMALLISVGNFGGIAGMQRSPREYNTISLIMFRTGSNIYIASQAPKYPTGFGTGLGISVAAIIMAFVLRKAFERENNKRRAMLAEEGEAAIRARYSEQEVRIDRYKGPQLTKKFANPSN